MRTHGSEGGRSPHAWCGRPLHALAGHHTGDVGGRPA